MDGLSTRVRATFALGAVATGTFATVPGLLLLPYLTDTLGIGALVAGCIAFLPKAWDVVLNPIAGRISDRSVARPGGRRGVFLLRSGAALSVCFALLFAGPGAPTAVAGAWVVVAFLGCATAYGFFQVPYMALPAEMTDDYAERTRLMTWRVAVLALAILVAGTTTPAIRDAVGGHQGYRVMGCYVAVLILFGAAGAYVSTRRVRPVRAGATSEGLRAQLRLIARVRPFRALLATFVLQALATGAMLAAVDYVARYLLESRGEASILFACFVAPALLFSAAWSRFAARYGKRAGYTAATLLLATGALGLLASLSGPSPVVYAATTVAGVGYAGAQIFPMAMLPDVAAVEAARTGENRVGVFAGVWTAGETLGLALGPGLYAVVLAIGGYVSSTDGAAVQPRSAEIAIALGFSVAPALLVLLSLVALRRYTLDAADVNAPAGPEGAS